MTTIGCVMIGRNDNYGGNLKERATYVLNSAILAYDEVIYVDYNSRSGILLQGITDNLYKDGTLTCIVVYPEFHKQHTSHSPGAQPCSEVLARNIGLRRLHTDVLVSTNIDEIQPPRGYLEAYCKHFLTDRNMVTVARHGTNLEHIQSIGGYKEIKKIQEYLINHNYPQSWEHKMTPDDIWSKVAWCGDLQMAKREVWYEIRGFEEWQLGSGIHDSYVQRKVMELGGDVEVSYDIPIYHLDHHKQSDYNEPCYGNSTELLGKAFYGIMNTEDWGFPKENFGGFKL